MAQPRGRGVARRNDEARRLIGSALLVLTIAIVVLGFVVLLAIELQLHAVNGAAIAAAHGNAERLARIAAEQSKDDADRLTGLLNIVFGPVVTLLGSVTGYYFGNPSRRRCAPSQDED
jgi:hypothetical protein